MAIKTKRGEHQIKKSKDNKPEREFEKSKKHLIVDKLIFRWTTQKFRTF